MSRPVSRAAIVAAIIKKDLREYSRNKLYIFLTVIGLVVFIGTFWVTPDTVEETIVLGVYQTDLGDLLERLESGLEEGVAAGAGQLPAGSLSQALELLQFPSPDALEAVIAGDLEAWRATDGTLVLRDKEAGDPEPGDAARVEVQVGIAFPDGFVRSVATDEPTTVTVYSGSAVPPELRGAMTGLVREMAYLVAGSGLPVTLPDQTEAVLGEGRAGDQVSLREKMRPMLAFFVLMIETFSLASLIASEVSARTVTAILVTPARLSDLLLAKTIYGMLLAFSQALILLLAVGAFTASNWPLLLVSLLLGGLMFTGVAMVTGAAGKDFLGTIFYGMLFMLPLAVPALAVLFPGSASLWVKVLPTYGLIQILTGATAYGDTWMNVTGYLALAVAWVAVLYAVGLFVLRRKVASL